MSRRRTFAFTVIFESNSLVRYDTVSSIRDDLARQRQSTERARVERLLGGCPAPTASTSCWQAMTPSRESA